MRLVLLVLANLLAISFISAQTAQVNIGSVGTDQFFRDNKFDPAGGGMVNVGYTNNGVTGNDLLIVKLDASRNIVWQESFVNPGDDAFYRVILCANGDYVAIGQMYQAGIRRGVACRINSVNGNIIWTFVSANSSVGEVFFDVVETANQNIALAGYDHYSPPLTNSFVVLLNSSGSTLWSFLSTRSNSDGFQAIGLLPNNNLIVGGIYIETAGGSYNAAILELSETNGNVVNQNTYSISASVPSIPYFFNTLSPQKFFIRNNTVICQMFVYQDFGSPSTNCVFIYDQSTKNLTGNILYHTGTDVASGYPFYPISENDFLLGSSYITPISSFVSRITNGSVVFNRKLNSSVSAITGLDVSGTNAAFAGSATISDLDGYNLFSTINLPVSSIPCDVSNSATFFLQIAAATGFSQNALGMVAGGSMVSIIPTVQTTAFALNNICGFVIPVTLINFTASYNLSTGSALLKWSTASELNSKVFLIQRSVDGGRTFATIGQVNAQGTSNTVVQYQFNDKDPQNGINLYRLKQIDLDNKFQYSDIVSVDAKKVHGSIYSLSPVPAKDHTFLKSTASETETVDILIIDALGRIINKQQSLLDINRPVKLELGNLTSGVFYVKLLSTKNKIVTMKLLVQ